MGVDAQYVLYLFQERVCKMQSQKKPVVLHTCQVWPRLWMETNWWLRISWPVGGYHLLASLINCATINKPIYNKTSQPSPCLFVTFNILLYAYMVIRACRLWSFVPSANQCCACSSFLFCVMCTDFSNMVIFFIYCTTPPVVYGLSLHFLRKFCSLLFDLLISRLVLDSLSTCCPLI